MKKKITAIVCVLFLLSGCKAGEQEKNHAEQITTQISSEQSVENNEKVIDYNKIKPNEIGHIMIIMYHGILDNPPYHRTKEDFIKDLQYLYDNNYRLISMNSYKLGKISIEAGCKPIVLTFDDGLPSTFSLEMLGGKLEVKKDTAIGIIEEFTKQHPDFGKGGVLYINGGTNAFQGEGTNKERLQWLVDNGYEIGNHTFSHAKLSKLTKDELIKEIGLVDSLIEENIKGYAADTISYPHGIRPAEEFRSFAVNGIYNNNNYNYVIGLREGPSGPMFSFLDNGFDAMNCPRVRGSEGEEGDLWWWLNYYQDHQEYYYVSDGDVNTISISKELENRVNQEKISKYGYKLNLY